MYHDCFWGLWDPMGTIKMLDFSFFNRQLPRAIHSGLSKVKSIFFRKIEYSVNSFRRGDPKKDGKAKKRSLSVAELLRRKRAKKGQGSRSDVVRIKTESFHFYLASGCAAPMVSPSRKFRSYTVFILYI